MTPWTSDNGATAIAATCRTQATAATAKPMVHQRELNNATTLRNGALTLISGASDAPRCLHSMPTFAIAAQARARAMPRVVMGYESVSTQAGLNLPPPA